MLRFLAILVLCFMLAYPVQARDNLIDIQEVTSAGGITAWLVEDRSIPIIAMQYSFKGIGSALESPQKQGLVRMLSNTMDEGAGDIDSQAFQKELQDLSITLHFSAGRDNFGGEFKTLTKNKDRAAELLRLALTQPRFDEDPITRMRQANQSRIRSSLADPEWIAARITNDRVFASHPYAHNSGGTLSTLENITRQDLVDLHKKLSRQHLSVAVVGDIAADELGALLDKVFGDMPATSTTPFTNDLELQNKGKTYLFEKDIPQTVITMRQKGIDRKHPDYHIAQVMNFILGSSGFGSRLTKEIREKRGLTYGIYSHMSSMDHAAFMGVSTSTSNETAAQMLSLIKSEWRKMRNNPVSAEELQSAQSYLIGSLPLSLTSTDKIASLLLMLQYHKLPINYLDQRQAAIENTTIEDIQRVAKYLLAPDEFTTVLVGQPVDIENAVMIESLPNAE